MRRIAVTFPICILVAPVARANCSFSIAPTNGNFGPQPATGGYGIGSYTDSILVTL